MRTWNAALFVFFLFLLASCADESPNIREEEAGKGELTENIFVDETLMAYLEELFSDVRTSFASDSTKSFSELSIVFTDSIIADEDRVPEVSVAATEGAASLVWLFEPPNRITYPFYRREYPPEKGKGAFMDEVGKAFVAFLNDTNEENRSAASAGFFATDALWGPLDASLEEVQECTGIHEGAVENLSLHLMSPIFDCPFYEDGCRGAFYQPNILKLGFLNPAYITRHELVHYLLFLSTGDADGEHTSPFFSQCVF